MKTALRNGLIAVSMGWIGLGMMANAKEAGTKPQLCVIVYNYVWESARGLKNAEKIAYTILEHAGVETTWMVYSRSSTNGAPYLASDTSCANTMARVDVNLVEGSNPRISGDALGWTPRNLNESGLYITYVFDDRANTLLTEESVKERVWNKSTILAYAMAHEIGHLMNLGHSFSQGRYARQLARWRFYGDGGGIFEFQSQASRPHPGGSYPPY